VPKDGYSADAMPWVWRINLTDFSKPVTEKVYPHPQLTIPNGADYHNGYVYWSQEGNYTQPGGIVQMDPKTLETKMLKNNFYGHRFNSPNDVVFTEMGVAFFTDGYYGYDNFNDTVEPELANGVYRWDSKTGNIKMVAGAADMSLYNPNGIALNLKQNKLFVTNRDNTSADSYGGRTIYSYDITTTGLKDREIFAYVDSGFPDGVKTDRDGRVYGAVTGGVDVFDKEGTLIGKIKVDTDDVAVNMVWVKDWLYIVGRSYNYHVQLNSGKD
jgi:gluconolactonase